MIIKLNLTELNCKYDFYIMYEDILLLTNQK